LPLPWKGGTFKSGNRTVTITVTRTSPSKIGNGFRSTWEDLAPRWAVVGVPHPAVIVWLRVEDVPSPLKKTAVE
jgi:hypothetical protein